tara:strand:+ start:207 stop:380 length:174 start_codon:yes stop_codon:yes gene_type:complete
MNMKGSYYIAATANTRLLTIRSPRRRKDILYNDGITPKENYWSVVIASLIVITLVVL